VTPDALDLARRLVALPGWRWMSGMLDTWGDRDEPRGAWSGMPNVPERNRPACLPDLDDPATGGVLLVALGREAARVRYSPSYHKQAAGTPWLADLFGSSCNSSITMHASLGRACAAVMIELAGRAACWDRQPRQAE